MNSNSLEKVEIYNEESLIALRYILPSINLPLVIIYSQL